MKRVFNEALKEYCGHRYYPWHMPGHKRQSYSGHMPEARFDVTEVPGLDNLYAPEGAIAESMAQLSEVYGSERSYYLVNGSTAGVLASIYAVCQRGDTIIMGRHCHKSVYHAVALLELKPVYLYPDVIEPYGICGSISPVQVETALKEHPKARAVIFPSPTYEGVLSDIAAISELVHEAGAYLIVDEAHGAHLEFGADFPLPAVRCGADLIIESLHKTLPCYTQCAILHIGKGRPENRMWLQNQIERYLSVFQTSSPSYLFVAHMEDCIATMEEWRTTQIPEYVIRLRRYRKRWLDLQRLGLLTNEEIIGSGGYAYDESKLVFCTAASGINGGALLRLLEQKYGMVMEMASLNYILGITSVMDTEQAFEKLDRALWNLDRELPPAGTLSDERKGLGEAALAGAGDLWEKPAETALLPGAAWDKKKEYISLMKAEGRLAGDYVTVYPPGSPILVPGERIQRLQAEYISRCIDSGLTVHGITDAQAADRYIAVLQERSDDR